MIRVRAGAGRSIRNAVERIGREARQEQNAEMKGAVALNN